MVTYEDPTKAKFVEKDLAILEDTYNKGLEQGQNILQIVQTYNSRFSVHTPGPTTVTMFLTQKGMPSFYNGNSGNIEVLINKEVIYIPWTVRRSPH